MPERQCATCLHQDEWGCYAEDTGQADQDGIPIWLRPAQVPMMLDGEEVYRCPRRPLKDDPAYWGRLLTHYGNFEKGLLPDAGGVVDQSNKAMSLFGIMADVTAECSREKAEREAIKLARR
jgi:hypothetical protein